MANFTDSFEVEVLKLLTGQATSIYTTTPIVPYVSLYTTAPTDASATGIEATGGGYARIITTSLWAAPTAGNPTTVSNMSEIVFSAFSGAVSSSAPFVAFGLHTGLTGTGNRVAWNLLADQTKTGATGDVIKFLVGQLTIALD